MELKGNADFVFIDNLAIDFATAFEIAEFDEIASRPTFEGERFHGDREESLLGRDFHDLPFTDDGANGDIVAGEGASCGDAVGEFEGGGIDLSGDGGLAFAEGIEFLGSEEGSIEGLAAFESGIGDPDILPELGLEGDQPIGDEFTVGADFDTDEERARDAIGGPFGDDDGVIGSGEFEWGPGAGEGEFEFAGEGEMFGEFVFDGGEEGFRSEGWGIGIGGDFGVGSGKVGCGELGGGLGLWWRVDGDEELIERGLGGRGGEGEAEG